MAGGRKPKPLHLKVVAGTDKRNKTRHNFEQPKPSRVLPKPPEWLSQRAADWFLAKVATLDGMGIASEDHVDMLSLAATRFDEVLECTAIIEDLGRTYTAISVTGSTMYKSRPEVAQRSEALRHLHSLLAEFGLSPSAVNKVKGGKVDDENEFDGF